MCFYDEQNKKLYEYNPWGADRQDRKEVEIAANEEIIGVYGNFNHQLHRFTSFGVKVKEIELV